MSRKRRKEKPFAKEEKQSDIRKNRMNQEGIGGKERIMQMILSTASLCLLLFGTRMGLVTAFDGAMDWEHFLFTFLVISLLLVIFIVNGTALRAAWSSVFIFAGMAIYAWRNIEDLEYYAEALAYYVGKRYDVYVKHVMMNPSRTLYGSLDDNFLLTGMCFILVYLVALIALRMGQASIGLIPVYLVFVAGLSFGKAPDKIAIILLVCGCGLVLFLTSVRHREKRARTKYFIRKGKKYTWNRASAIVPTLCILGISVLAGLQLCANIEADVMQNAPAFQRKQVKVEEKIIRLVSDTAQYLRGLTGLGGDGLLSNSQPHYTNSKVMEVTIDFKPHTSIYLRGFTGETYKNGRWIGTDEEDFRQNFNSLGMSVWNLNYEQMAKMERFLAMEDNELVNTMNTLLWWDISEDNIGDMAQSWRGGLEGSIHYGNMTLTYMGKERYRKTGYVPYIADFFGNKGIKILGDGSLQRDGRKMDTAFLLMSQQRQKKYVDWMSDMGETLDTIVDSMLITGEMTDTTENDDEDDSYGEYKSTYSLWDSYQHYADVHYGNTNDGNLPLYQEFAEQYHFGDTEYDSVSEVVGKVQRILWDNTTYSLDLKPLPMGQDYAEYFLFYQQKGYCEHYATSGTILLRECNIPARYVSGYRIDNNSFKDNGDGTYTAKVLDSDAHAWTETWHYYTGWLPWEMTPADGTGIVDEEDEQTEEGQSVIPERTIEPPSDVQQSSQPDNEPTPSPTPTMEPEESDAPQVPDEDADESSGKTKNGKGSSGKMPYISPKMTVAGAVVILIVTGIGVLYIRRVKQNIRRNRIHREIPVPGTVAVGFCAAYMVDALRTVGKTLDKNADEKTWMGLIKDNYPGLLTEEEQEEMLQIVQVGTYSKQGASVGEQRRFWRLCRKCLRGIAETVFLPRRIIFYMIFKKE